MRREKNGWGRKDFTRWEITEGSPVRETELRLKTGRGSGRGNCPQFKKKKEKGTATKIHPLSETKKKTRGGQSQSFSNPVQSSEQPETSRIRWVRKKQGRTKNEKILLVLTFTIAGVGRGGVELNLPERWGVFQKKIALIAAGRGKREWKKDQMS